MKKKGILISVLLIVFILLTGLDGYGQDKGKGDEVYVIKRGDTLWDLSDSYLNDPYGWPELWQRNQYITNPHLIYPGNSLRLFGKPKSIPPETAKEAEMIGAGVTEAAPLSETAETTGIEGGVEESAVAGKKEEVATPQKAEQARVTGAEEVVELLRKEGVEFVLVEEDSLGRIIDAKYQKRLLAQGDTVYVAMKKRPPEVGERFLIFRTQKELKNPYTGKRGKKIYVVGALEITAVKGVLYQAEITDSLDAVLRGDEIMTYRAIE